MALVTFSGFRKTFSDKMTAININLGGVIVQLDDEASLLPRKLQAALEQALQQRNHIIDQDSDSESDDGKLDNRKHLIGLNLSVLWAAVKLGVERH